MKYLFFYLVILFVTFITVYIVTYFIPMKRDRLGMQGSFKYIVKKYEFSMNKQKVRLLAKIIAFVNSFILSIPIMLIVVLKTNIYVIFLISFIIFIVLIISLYNLVGFILKKKGW